MFCKNCGTQLGGNERFCPGCGAPAEDQPAYRHGNRGYQSFGGGAPAKTGYGMLKIIIPALLILIAAAGGLLIFRSLRSADRVAVKAAEAIADGDMEAYCSLLAPPYKEYMLGPDGWFENEGDLQADLFWSLEYISQDFSDSCGGDYRVDCEAIDRITFEDQTLESVRRSLQEDYHYDGDEVKKAEVITVSVQASGSLGEESRPLELACVKIGGSWYIHHPGLNTY